MTSDETFEEERIIFHQDNASTHKGVLAIRKTRYFRDDLLGHLAYSLYFAPSDFHVFPHLKKLFSGERFASNEVERIVHLNFNGITNFEFREGILIL